MEHYVIINSWANEYENGVTILGVAHSIKEAESIFNEFLMDEKNYAEEHGWEIFEDSEVEFDAGENGYHASNHTRLYIQAI